MNSYPDFRIIVPLLRKQGLGLIATSTLIISKYPDMLNNKPPCGEADWENYSTLSSMDPSSSYPGSGQSNWRGEISWKQEKYTITYGTVSRSIPSNVAAVEHMSCICNADQHGLVALIVHAAQYYTRIKNSTLPKEY